ncbi:tyrosine-type recombinase/integrase [Sulfurimonas sp.]|uniref:tyrosine-type recombinase/integrase n=1 Tax=Sulfurimonas sp. TaxID=2022749 RepID=UPI0025CC382F|nr:tyrosine-type recombinase/integrase [Sulfurimonas sp.]
MIKEQLIHFDDLAKDLLLWVKHFISNKVAIQKVDNGYTDKKPKKNQAKDEIFFDRKEWQNKILDTESIEEFQAATFEVRNNGLKKLSTFSVPTIHLYNYLIKLKKLKSIRDVNTNILYNYVSIEYAKYKDHTQKSYFTHIKSLFKFIDKYSISSDDFIFDIGITPVGKRAKAPVNLSPKKSIKYLEPDDFVKFIKSISGFKSKHPNPMLPNLMLKIFCFTGLRANELRNIEFDKDVSFKKIKHKKYLKLYIHGKNDIDRFAHVSYDLIKKEYEAYLAARETECKYLFYNRDNKQYADNTIYDLVKRVFAKAKEVGIDITNLDTHGLRRSFATYLHSRGVAFDTISIILGHSDKESSEFYIFASKKSFTQARELLDDI